MAENSYLYLLPLGRTMRDNFIKNIQGSTDNEALLVVPGRFFQQEVRRQGVLRAVIIDYLPNAILRLSGAKPLLRISRMAQQMLIRQLLQEMGEAGKLQYFADSLDKDGIVESLMSFMGELSQDNVEPEELAGALGSLNRTSAQQHKDHDVLLLYTLYREQLYKLGCYDINGLYRLAIAALREHKSSLPWKKLFFSEFYRFNALQIELITELSKCCSVEMGLFYDAAQQELSAVSAPLRQEFLGAGFVQVKTELKPKHIASKLTFLKAGNLEEEMRHVLHHIKRRLLEGAHCSDVVCLTRGLDAYVGLSNLFAEYGIPAALPQVTNLAAQPLGTFVRDVLLTALNPSDVAAWQKLLAHPLLSLLYGLDIRRLQETYNEVYFEDVACLQHYVLDKIKQNNIGEFFEWVKALHVKQNASALLALLSGHFRAWNLTALWGSGYQAGKYSLNELNVLVKTLQLTESFWEELTAAYEQSGLEQQTINAGDVLAAWSEYAAAQTVVLAAGSKEGVRVMEVTEVQNVTFPYVFLMGVREGQFPRIKRPDWLYIDAERQELSDVGINLALSSAAALQERYFFAAATVLAEKELIVSYSEDDAAGASTYLQDLRAAAGVDLPEAESFRMLPEEACSRRELAGLLADKSLNELNCTLQEWLNDYLGEDYRQRCVLDIKRFEGESSYNGYLAFGDERDTFSATALNAYEECPFKYMGSQYWRLDAWEPLTEAAQPFVKGNLYHEVLAHFLSKYCQKNLAEYPQEELQQALHDDLLRIYNNYIKSGQIVCTEFSSYEIKDYDNCLQRWLQNEIYYQQEQQIAFRPKHFELAFGRNTSQSLPPYVRSIAGKDVKFSGQIDRIDSNGELFMITDYKSGYAPTNTVVSEGTNLQLPLYLLALLQLSEVSGRNVCGAGYYALRTGERKGGLWNEFCKNDLPWLKGRKIVKLEETMKMAEQKIDACVEAIGKGVFPVNMQSDCGTGYCPYKDICRWRMVSKTDVQKKRGDGNDIVY